MRSTCTREPRHRRSQAAASSASVATRARRTPEEQAFAVTAHAAARAALGDAGGSRLSRPVERAPLHPGCRLVTGLGVGGFARQAFAVLAARRAGADYVPVNGNGRPRRPPAA